MHCARRFFAAGLVAAPLFAGGAALAAAAQYEFLAPPETDFNLMYRLDKSTGEVGACQFFIDETRKGVGITLCFPPGEGAKAGEPSDYALVGSHHTGESGVYRVDQRTGLMSACYLLRSEKQIREGSVVCTPPAK